MFLQREAWNGLRSGFKANVFSSQMLFREDVFQVSWLLDQRFVNWCVVLRIWEFCSISKARSRSKGFV